MGFGTVYCVKPPEFPTRFGRESVREEGAGGARDESNRGSGALQAMRSLPAVRDSPFG